jgi:NADPH-dependent glutamate synthase beta subunit-like oxidoreductase/2,4-dienoyl-CoA reductase-like NADH-dependent reductase (Old Yellow Enzyme family)
MTEHQRFSYRTLDELQADIDRLGLTDDLPISRHDGIEVLFEPVSFGRLTCPNRLSVQPMEGCDAGADGTPSDLTFRRYERFGAGGAGLIWFEACAVVPEARANPHQLWLHEGSLSAFKELLDRTRQTTGEAACVLQLTHSGRYSRPKARPAPIIAHHSEVLDQQHNLGPDYPLISDDEIDRLQDSFLAAAQLAVEAGFDGVDIKSCHRYLISELLASHTREDSRYGGSFVNRTRLLREVAAKIRERLPQIEVTCRLNAYDAIRYPFGWGVDRDDAGKYDLAEPLKLVGQLAKIGFGGINISIGNPYFNPHYNRPFDWPAKGMDVPDEHPLHGVARMVRIVREVQEAFPDMTVVGTGYTWLRHYFPSIASEVVRRGWAKIVGLGRGALAYPDFARDLRERGEMDRLAVCVSCSSCTQLMRDGGQSGCVVRDADVYGPIYKRYRRLSQDEAQRLASQCRECVDATCAAACPAGVDVPAFVKAVADGRDREAYGILRRVNLLPEMCALVCPVEVQCEGECLQKWLGDGAVPIADIQRYVSDRARREGWTAADLSAPQTGNQVAVVGAGPSGLSCAAGLLEQGHRVVIFEKQTEAGGKAVSVIPRRRLGRTAGAAEIAAILGDVARERLEWRFAQPLRADFDLDDVLAEGFDAVMLGMGLDQTVSLLGPDRRPEGVLDSMAFLSRVKVSKADGGELAGRVAVLGGGNTAVDAACEAKRCGADDVYLIYRRSFDQMPAWPGERERCVSSGVHMLLLTQPVGYDVDEDGRLQSVRVVRTSLGEPDDSGRRRAVVVPGSEHAIPVDMCIEALGEQLSPQLATILNGVRLSREGLVAVGDDARYGNPYYFQTSRTGVFAAGDLVNGGTTVVQAVAEGLAAAQQIDRFLDERPAPISDASGAK